MAYQYFISFTEIFTHLEADVTVRWSQVLWDFRTDATRCRVRLRSGYVYELGRPVPEVNAVQSQRNLVAWHAALR